MTRNALAVTVAAAALQVSPVVAADKAAVLDTYADIAQAGYEDSLTTARELGVAVDALIAEPSAEALEAAKDAWIEARVPYQQTEVYRFGNPIVDDWEGKVKAWPLDEGLIDYTAGAYGGPTDENPYAAINVVANASFTLSGEQVDAGEIDAELLTGTLHEADAIEANVATGYHAIEFLLWGQDLNGTDPGAGNRPWTDYARGDACTHGNCDRRAEYLKTATDLLISDLEWMAAQWAEGGAARAALMTDPDAGIVAILTGMGSLSYGEQAGDAHHPVPHLRPDELAALKPLRDQHQPGAVPDQHLDPVGPLRAEHEDRPAEGVEPEHLLHHRRQPVMALAEVHRARRHINRQVPARRDHPTARTARSTRARCASPASGPARITTSPSTISMLAPRSGTDCGASSATRAMAPSCAAAFSPHRHPTGRPRFPRLGPAMRPALALLPLLLAAPARASDIGIADFEVTGAQDTALAVALDAAVNAANRAVGDCREAGGSPESCLCQSRPEITDVRAALDSAIAANPEWEAKTLFDADTGGGQSLTIFLDTIARMAAPPACR